MSEQGAAVPSRAEMAATLAADIESLPATASPGATMTARSATVLPGVEGKVGAAPTHRARYTASALLGQGGMGEVVLADDHDIDRRVAIKRLRADVAMNAPTLQRFADEVRTAGALQHPNIVPVYDVGVDVDGQHYFVMKHLEGESLESVIEKLAARDPAYEQKYTWAVRATICIETLRALEYAHSRGILHRDVKPANMMIGPHGEVTLTDWGVAKKIVPRPVPDDVCTVGKPEAPSVGFSPLHVFLEKFGLSKSPKGGAAAPRVAGAPVTAAALATTEPGATNAPGAVFTNDRPLATAAGVLVGTPLYMSPEQAACENQIDERSDLFSASAMFGELFSLRHYLADRTTLRDVLDGVLHEDFYVRYGIALVATTMPAEMMHVVMHGMWREPDKRWQSAKEMAAAFERTLSGDIWVCCPFTLTRRTSFLVSRWVNENPRTLVSMILLTLLSLVAAIVFLIVRLAH